MPRNHHKNAEEKVLEIIKRNLKGTETIVIGVSGGPDSIFLLNCLLKFNSHHKKFKIIVAHVNHMLRGKEAEEDMKFVESLCKKNAIQFELEKIDVEALSKTTKSSVEESGREIRYNFFEKLFKEFKADFCITAHHSDDNLETILLNLIRGASVKGLAGMKISTKKKSGLRIFRPLLCVSKEEIMDFMNSKKIKYRIDRSNMDTTITRNFLRHKVIPVIKTLNPNLSQTVLKNAKTFEDLHNYIHLEAQKWIRKHRDAKKSYHIKSFTPLPLALKKQIILTIYQEMVGETKNIENKHVEEVIEVIERNIGGKKKKLGRYIVEIKQGRFIFSK